MLFENVTYVAPHPVHIKKVHVREVIHVAYVACTSYAWHRHVAWQVACNFKATIIAPL